MKLEYLDDISAGGKYPWADPDRLIRLYDFDQNEARWLIDLIESKIIRKGEKLDFSKLAFIEPLNCNLVLELDLEDIGIEDTVSGNEFICRLKSESYSKMIGYMSVFAYDDADGYNWLYDPKENRIDLLFSPGGTW